MIMDFLIKTNDVAVLSSQKGSVARFEGRSLDEIQSVRILWSKGIRFSRSKGRARKKSPLEFLMRDETVPRELCNVVLTKGTSLGNKCWGRIDHLVKYCGYQLRDERD